MPRKHFEANPTTGRSMWVPARCRAWKRLALKREIQTGHADSDHGVYVEAEAEDPTVQTLLSTEIIRVGVMSLLQTADDVAIRPYGPSLYRADKTEG